MAANLDNGVILGALGSSISIDSTTGAMTPPPGMIIASIQFIGTCKINALVAEDPNKTFNTVIASHQDDDGGAVVGWNAQDHGDGGNVLTADTPEFPAGMVIYGRWTSASFTLNDQGVILYFGY